MSTFPGFAARTDRSLRDHHNITVDLVRSYCEPPPVLAEG
jgi:hypothetical protein